MPMINKPCHNCGKSDKPVHERYQCVSGTSMKFKPEPIGDKLYRIVPENMEYWCTDCYKLENAKMKVMTETVDLGMPYRDTKEIVMCSHGWRKIEDKQPHAGQEILFCDVEEKFLPTTFGLYLGDKFSSNRFYSHDGNSYNATHWMPLPNPPFSEGVKDEDI